MRRAVRRAVSVLVTALALLGAALARARETDVPFSPVFGDPRVGADFPERRGLTTAAEPRGEMDDMAAYARSAARDGDEDADADDSRGFDPAAVDPEVRRFYERTAEYRMAYRVRWHRGFRTGAALAAPLTTRIEQLNLPGPRDGEGEVRELRSRFAAIDPAADPRPGARAWVRTDGDSGEAVFVALYASHERDGERFVNIAAPLPGCNLSTVLRLSHLPVGGDERADGRTAERDDPRAGRTGVELTTDGDEPGLYLVTPLGAVALPMDQRFRVWPADVPGAPDAVDPRATLVATHEMWFRGRPFLTVEYAMWPEDEVVQDSTSTS